MNGSEETKAPGLYDRAKARIRRGFRTPSPNRWNADSSPLTAASVSSSVPASTAASSSNLSALVVQGVHSDTTTSAQGYLMPQPVLGQPSRVSAPSFSAEDGSQSETTPLVSTMEAILEKVPKYGHSEHILHMATNSTHKVSPTRLGKGKSSRCTLRTE
jgi:hypothetical protein